MRCDACNCTLLNRFLVVAPSVLALCVVYLAMLYKFWCAAMHRAQFFFYYRCCCYCYCWFRHCRFPLLQAFVSYSCCSISIFASIFIQMQITICKAVFHCLYHIRVCLCLISIMCEYRVSETEFYLKISISNRFHCAAALPHHNGAVRVHHHQTIQLRMMCVFNQIAIDNDVHMWVCVQLGKQQQQRRHQHQKTSL